MTITTHPVSPEEVMALLDGELSAERTQAVSVHLDQCAECSAVAEKLSDVSQYFAPWTVPASTLNVKDLRSSPHRASSGFERILSIPARWGLGVIATAVVVTIVFSSGRLRYSSARSGDQVTVKSWEGLGGGGGDREPAAPVNGRDLVQLQQLAAPLSGTKGKLESPYGKTPDSEQLMIARLVSLTIIVKDFVTARANLDLILARHHGYAAQLNASTAENAARSLNGSLRVPAGELGSVVSELKVLGRVQIESQSGEEVTQQHADLVARLKNSRETERRLQAILAERTGKISDVLAVEQEIARVRGEIERMEAEQKSLEHRVEFATIDLNLTEEYKAQLVIPPLSMGTRLHNALVEGYRNATETLLSIALFFAEYCLTLLLWAIILGLPSLYFWRRYRRSLATA